MKAYEILMFLLIFNLVLWLLGGYGLNIYQLGVYSTGVEGGTGVLEQPSGDVGLAFLAEVATVGFMAIIIAISAAAIGGYLLRAVPTPQSFIYYAFIGLFWTSYGKTIQVFYNIAHGVPGIFFTIFLVFTAITAYVFFVGFSQIVTQSWRQMR